MTSQIQVVNAALRLIGTRRITALDQTSVEATEAEDAWARTLDATLRAHPWNFAMKLASIAAHADAPAWAYTAAFPIPSDCLRVWAVDSVPWTGWQVMQHGDPSVTAILANATGPLKIAYISRVDDVSRWDPLAVAVLEIDLALALSKKITTSNPDVESLFQQRRVKLTEAKQADAVENPPSDLGPDDWVYAREDGGVGSYWPRYV